MAAARGGTQAQLPATIDWGDGSLPAGTIVVAGGQNYTVRGLHTYASNDVFTVTVTINESIVSPQ